MCMLKFLDGIFYNVNYIQLIDGGVAFIYVFSGFSAP